MSEVPKLRQLYEAITHRGFLDVWTEDCRRYWGRFLEGEKRHYCPDFDYLPIDETCKEFNTCTCKYKEQK